MDQLRHTLSATRRIAAALFMPVTPRLALAAAVFAAHFHAVRADISVTVDPESGRTPISPCIYGVNQDLPGVAATARRWGGNRTTGYNWETNASNAGSDWRHSSDDYVVSSVGIPAGKRNIPAIAITHFVDESIAARTPYSIVTLPMAGYVAADKNGPVTVEQTAPSSRWCLVKNTKPAAFSARPDTTDGVVYTDELLHLLVTRYGPATAITGIKAYSLDNEPDLWASTHPRIHPSPASCTEFLSRSVSLAQTIKRMDPAAETVGFVSYGFNGYYSFQNAPDWKTEQPKGPYRWFIDCYLDHMRSASREAGRRLIDVLDVHHYTEDYGGGERVSDSRDFTNTACNQERMQAPRALWDPSFAENSWIRKNHPDFYPYLPQLKASIATWYPGTKLGITEYCYGGESHISGGLAEADALGIFGREGVYLANFWQLDHAPPVYIAAAFNLYLNYDGNGGRFGDTSLATSVSDIAQASAYASANTTGDTRLHLVVLNKTGGGPSTVSIRIAGSRRYTRARVYAFDAASSKIIERVPVTGIVNNQFDYALPALTAAHFVLADDSAHDGPHQ